MILICCASGSPLTTESAWAFSTPMVQHLSEETEKTKKNLSVCLPNIPTKFKDAIIPILLRLSEDGGSKFLQNTDTV